MGQQKEPKKYELAEVDYIAGMKYKDIAEKYGVSINTVKSWKTRYKWTRKKKAHKTVGSKKKNSRQKHKVIACEIKAVMDNYQLTDKQRLFCVYYVKLFNATKAYQTELAVHIADRYILMHECDEGYDYSILNEQYHLLDGGVYDNPDITIQRAMDMVIADLKEPRFSAVTEQYYRDEYLQGEVYVGSEIEIVDYEGLSEKAEEVEQSDLAAQQAEFRENNPDVVADFRAKTEELFHSLDGQSAEDIEKTIYAYVQSQIDEYGLDAEIVDVVVAGSRCRGIEKENSDLDVVVEYTGSTREDDLFNMLHEDSIYIAGIQVDINPITEGKTGTLETYLPEVETYLQEKAQQEQINNQFVTQGREVVQEQNALASEEKVHSELEKEPVIEPETVYITFTVAECGEFHNMGGYHEGIETIEEAMKLYNAIDPSRMQGIPSIGVNMHIEGTEEWEDEQADIVSGKRIDVDFLNYTPELRDTPKVQDAIKKLIAAYPEKDVIDMETKEHKIRDLRQNLTSYPMILTLLNTETRYRTGKHRFK